MFPQCVNKAAQTAAVGLIFVFAVVAVRAGKAVQDKPDGP
jgi:hypothetical protein